MKLALLLTTLLAPQGASSDRSADLLVHAGRLVVAPGTVLENQSILIRAGRVAAVGPEISEDAARGARRIDYSEATVVPGFVDPHTHLGQGADLVESATTVTPHLHALDAFDPFHEALLRRARGGVTTACLAPLSANTFAGIAGVVKTGRTGEVVSDAAYLLLALVDESFDQGRFPTSRMGALELIRDRFAAARREAGPPNPAMAALRDVVAGSLRLAIHARKHADIVHALDLCEELGVRPLLLGVERPEKLLDRIARLRGSVVLAPRTLADRRRRLELPARLEKAGIPFSFMSTAPPPQTRVTRPPPEPRRRGGRRPRTFRMSTNQRPTPPPEATPEQLRLSAALAVRYGASNEAALAALTRVPAEQCGVADRCGSLREGRDADFLVFDTDPIQPAARLLAVYLRGRLLAPENGNREEDAR